MKNSRKTMFPVILTFCLLLSSCAVAKPMKSAMASEGLQAASALPSSLLTSSIIVPSSSFTADELSPVSTNTSSFVSAKGNSLKNSSAGSRKPALKTETEKIASKVLPEAVGKVYGPPLYGFDFLVDVNHRLFLTPSPFMPYVKSKATPEQIIGKVGSCNVASIKGETQEQAVCVFSSVAQNWQRFSFFCEDTITVQGRAYHFTDGSTGNLYYADAPLTDKSEINVVSTAPSNVSSSFSQIDAAVSANTASDYTLQIILYPKIGVQIPAIKNKVIGKISGGKVWSLDDIDPSQAIAIQAESPSGEMWLLATKQNGYTGKTVADVLTEKGARIQKVY